MASQVLAFLRPTRRGTDWTQGEIAELYRIEHALLQARFSMETDRGVSDEGDPWFVFCRADGEVLVHITRSDEGYLLYGLGLPAPLTGRVIGDISKSFVNQIPLNIPVRQKDGPQLFVHPAATLAIIVGMIFLANDDVSLVAGSDRTAVAAAAGEGAAEPVGDRGVKASVLAVLGKLADGTLLGGPRIEASHQEGNYLNIVCTIAAVMMGASVAFDSGSEDLTQTVSVDAAAAAAEPEHAQQSSSDLIDTEMAMRVDGAMDDALAAARPGDDRLSVVLADDAQSSEAMPSVTSVEVAQNVRQQAPDVGSVAILDHEKTSLTVDATAFDQPKPMIPAEAAHAPVAAASSEPPPEPARQVVPGAASASSSPAGHREEAGTAADEVFQHVLKSVGLTDRDTSADRVLSHASAEILESIPAPLPVAAEPVRADAASDVRIDAKAEVAHGTLYPLFDNAAREYLTSFLQSHPESTAFFYEQNVIIYDGDRDFSSRPVTVQVFEFDTGATIAIVGHNDYPLYHV